MAKGLGLLETKVLAYAQMRRLGEVRSGDLAKPLGFTPLQEARVLTRLARSGMIVRVRPGLYLVPPRLPLGGRWSPDEFQALNALMADRGAQYQICGPNAFARYGFDDQVPTRLYVYNNGLSGQRRIGSVSLTLIEVADDRLGSVERVKMPDGQVAVYSSRVRTLVDAVYDWSRFGSLPRAYDWICNDVLARKVTPEELVRTATRFGNQGTLRRLGLLLEREGVSKPLLCRIERGLRTSKGLIPWIPTNPRRGPINSRWGVIVNG